MLDFTSSLYLGLRHPSERLPAWRALTTGVPAALSVAAGTRPLEGRVTALCGYERASLAPSTLHLVWDLFSQLPAGADVYLDAGAYATLRWGAERAAARGARLRVFGHHDADALAALVRAAPARRTPVVACDGICPWCGRCAPLARYLGVAGARGGAVVVDDTQAVGLLGRRPDLVPPYGAGGGGTRRHAGPTDGALVTLASFAKAFGAPVAALLGPAETVARYEGAAETRVHSSPASAAARGALDRALEVNAWRGDELRARLARRVAAFRGGVRACGLDARGGWFPVQTVAGPGLDAVRTHRALLETGVRAVLRAGSAGPELCFVLTARHTTADVRRAVAALAAATGDASRRRDAPGPRPRAVSRPRRRGPAPVA